MGHGIPCSLILVNALIVTVYVHTPSRLGQDANFGFMTYGQKWRRYRRHFWKHFTARAIEQYQPVQRAVAHQFLARLLDHPSRIREHIH